MGESGPRFYGPGYPIDPIDSEIHFNSTLIPDAIPPYDPPVTTPGRSARDLAIARLQTAWLWRIGDPRSLDPTDVAVMEALRLMVDGLYIEAASRLKEADNYHNRQDGLE